MKEMTFHGDIISYHGLSRGCARSAGSLSPLDEDLLSFIYPGKGFYLPLTRIGNREAIGTPMQYTMLINKGKIRKPILLNHYITKT